MLETGTTFRVLLEASCRSCVGDHRGVPGSLLLLSSTGLGIASSFLWSGYRTGRCKTCLSSFSGFCFFCDWTHWKKGWEGGAKPTPTHKATSGMLLSKRFSQAGAFWSWLLFQSFLALEKVLPEDADMITCFSFAQRICSVLRTCIESWHSSFLGTRVSASVLLTCWLSLIAFFVFKKNSFPLGRSGSALFCRKTLYTVCVYNLSSLFFFSLFFFVCVWSAAEFLWSRFKIHF